MTNIDIWGPKRRGNSRVKAVYANVKGISIGLYNDVLNVYNKDQLEWEVTYSIVLEGTKDKGLKCNNPYRRC